MATDRSVEVSLKLDISQYLRGLAEARTATKDFSRDANKATADIDKGFADVEQTTRKSAPAIRDVDRAISDTSKTTLDGSRNFHGLAGEIETTRARYRELIGEFNRTGDQDLITRITGDRTTLGRLERMNKELSGVPGNLKEIDNSLSGLWKTASEETGPLLAANIAYAISAGAPVIGAAVSSALLAGIAGGTLAGGVALAWADQRVQTASQRFARDVGNELHQSAAAGLAGGLAGGINDLRVDILRLGPVWDQTFAALRPALDSLLRGLTGLLDKAFASGNWQLALEEGARILSIIGDRLPEFGKSLDLFFGSLARSGPGAERFMNLFLQWIDGAVIGLGLLIELLSKAFKVMTDLSSVLLGPLGAALTAVGAFGDTSKKAFTDLRTAAEDAAPPIGAVSAAQEKLNATLATASGRADELRGQIDALYGSQVGVIDGTEGFNKAILDLDASVRQNGASLSDHTVKGLANRDALEAAAKASVDLMVADIANGDSLEIATQKHQARIDKLRVEADRLHLTRDETNNLISAYGAVPGNVETNVRLTGAEGVLAQLKTLKIAQYALDNNVSIPAASSAIAGQSGLFNQQVPYAARFATGGYLDGPGSKTSDSLLIRASRGEYVQSAGAVDFYGTGLMDALNLRKIPREALLLAGVPGYAGGGQVWPFPVNAAGTKIPKTMAQLQQDAISAAVGIGAGGGNWAALAQAVASALGQPNSWPAIVRRIAFESGGNPTIVNTSDSNWFAGHPSVGLAQVIAGTFAAYAGAYRNVGPFEYGVSVNPFANVYAGMNYATHRYGSIAAVDPLVMHSGYAAGGLIPIRSYDSGGWLDPGLTLAYNGTGTREPVGGGAGLVIQNLNVTAPVGASGIDIGRQVVDVIKKYERVNGTLWRNP